MAKRVLTQAGLLSILEPEREAKLGFAAARHVARERWLREGRLGDEDEPFPWLRAAQVNGLELVIIGYTLDAVRVCNEAYHAGFKAVLVVLEDHVEDPQVVDWLEALSLGCWNRYPFKNGPVLISAKTSTCLVRINEEGAVDTYVRTNIGGVLTNSESWQYFQGPAIVVDALGAPEMEAPADSEEIAAELEIPEDSEEVPPEIPRNPSCVRASGKQGGANSGETSVPKGSSMTPLRASPMSSPRLSPRMCPRNRPGKPGAAGPRLRLAAEASEDMGSLCTRTSVTVAAARDADVPDLDRMRTAFLARVANQRAKVVEPRFWQERYDPERFGFRLAPYRLVWLYALFGLIASFSFSAEGKATPGYILLAMRVSVRFICLAPGWLSMAIFVGSSLGLVARNHPSALNIKAAVMANLVYLFVLYVECEGHTIAEFTGGVLGMLVLFASSALLAHCGPGVSRHNLRWSLALFAILLLTLVLSLMLPLLYLVVQMEYTWMAAVLLWPMATVFEQGLCHALRVAYHRLVWQPRQRGAEVSGDQRGPQCVVAMAVLSLIELGKCIALLGGAIQTNLVSFMHEALLSMVVGLALNSSLRTGWLYSYPAVRLPRFRAWLCPDSLTIYFQDCRSLTWWTQPFIFSGMMLGRGWVTDNWTVPGLTATDTDVWCWSQITLLVFGFLVARNLIEDYLVNEFFKMWPAPLWQGFGELMQERLDSGETSDPYHPIHCLSLHRSSALTSAGKLRPTARGGPGGPSRLTRRAVLSQHCQVNLAPRILASPHCAHTRESSHFEHLLLVALQVWFDYVLLTLTVGILNFRGLCQPHSLLNVRKLLMKLFVVAVQTECHDDPS